MNHMNSNQLITLGYQQARASFPPYQRRPERIAIRGAGDITFYDDDDISVLSYGAIGDGMADDTEAVRTALRYGGGVFPEGIRVNG
jgi:hypothetical protein